MDPSTEAVIAIQLGRAPRGLRAVAHMCPCGLPDVVETAPRLPDGTPFPTLYYLTCPRAAAAVSKLEAAGTMRAMTGRLAHDEDLRRSYEAAHQDYLARRRQAALESGIEPLPPGTQSAGGMPERVKCLHAIVAHELAVPGAQPARPGSGRCCRTVVGGWAVRNNHAERSRRAFPRVRLPRCDERRPMTRRVAAIDCGTNSIRLLVADVDPERGTLTDVDRRMEIVRLGQGVDTSGRLAPEALDRTMHALSGYAAVITRLDASDVRMAATSAARDAANAGEFVRRVTAVLGTAPEVLSGDEEARLSFTGATAELDGVPSAEPAYLVVDIGGGSTEFVLGAAGTVSAAASVDIGCVRMTERHLRSDPPSPEQIAAATADIDAAVGRAAATVDGDRARTLVGLAGSVTTVAGIAMDLPAYDSARLHHVRVAAAEVHAVATRLLCLTRAERARIAVMHPGRVDVIGAGALILDRIMSLIGLAEVLVSEHDILDGIAWSLAAPQKAPGR